VAEKPVLKHFMSLETVGEKYLVKVFNRTNSSEEFSCQDLLLTKDEIASIAIATFGYDPRVFSRKRTLVH